MEVFVKIVEDNFFKDFTTNWEQRYWPIILNQLFITFFKIGVTFASFHISGYVEVAFD